jgi:HlyD family secretion protein
MKHRRAGVAIVLLAVATGVVLGVRARRSSETSLVASGTVEATEAELGFQASGRIDSIGVREGDLVEAGRELAHLDRAEAAARLQQVEAQAAAARATLQELESGSRHEEVEQGRAARDAARQRRDDAHRDLERTRQLHEGGAVSREALDKARTAFDVAESQLHAAQEQLELLERGPRPERIAAQRALVAQSDAAVLAARAGLDQRTVRAPFAGLVSLRHRQPGEIVAAGAPVLTVLDRDDRWVRIYIPENRLGAVHVGAPARISADTDPRRTYAGQVVFIASEAEFTPKTVQTTEERVKLVYAAKVRITDDPGYDLKPGMPADVRLEVAP